MSNNDTDFSPPAFVTIEELATYFKVSVQTIRVWLRKKIIPPHTYLHVRDVYRFKPELVAQALIDANISTHIPDAEPDEDDLSDDGPEQFELDLDQLDEYGDDPDE